MSEATAVPDQKQIFRVALREHHRLGDRTIRFLGHRRDRGDRLGRRFLQASRPCRRGRGDCGLRPRHHRFGRSARFIFGHIADRRGRKDAMVYALVLMGVATLLIGLTPTYDSIGADRAGAADHVSSFAGHQFRRRVRHGVDLGGRTSGAIEIPRLLGRLGRLRDSDRASARLRLGDFREVSDDGRAASTPGAGASSSSSASSSRSSA